MTTIQDLLQNQVAVNHPSSANGTKTPQDRKLTDAAQQFEAIFLQEMLSLSVRDRETGWAEMLRKKRPEAIHCPASAQRQ